MRKPTLFDTDNFKGALGDSLNSQNDAQIPQQSDQTAQQGLTRPAMIADQPNKEPGIFGKIGGFLKEAAPVALPALAGLAGGVGLLPGIAAGFVGKANRDSYEKQQNTQSSFKNSELDRQREHDKNEATIKKMHEDNEKSSKDYQNQIANIMAGLKGREVNIEGDKAKTQEENTKSEIAHRDKPGLMDYVRYVGNAIIGNPNDTPSASTPGSSNVHPILPGEKYTDYLKRVSP